MFQRYGRKFQWIFIVCLVTISPVFAQDTPPSNGVNEAAWNPTYPWLAVAGVIEGEYGIYVFDSDGNLIHQLPLSAGVSSMEWSPDGDRLAARLASIPEMLSIWDAQTLENLNVIELPSGATGTHDIHWSPNSRDLASSQINIDIWNVENVAQEAFLLHPPGYAVTAFAWHPNGEILYTVTDDKILRSWDVAQASVIYESQILEQNVQNSNSIVSMDVSPDGTQLALGDSRGHVHFIDSMQGTELSTLTVYTNPVDLASIVWLLDWQDEGTLLAVSSFEGPSMVWDVTTGQLVSTFPRTLPGFIKDIALSPYGGRLAIANDNSPYAPELSETEANSFTAWQSFANGAVQIVVPDPSPERLQAIAESCNAPLPVEQAAASADTAAELVAFETAVEALPAEIIPPACAADLLAVAEAMQGQ
jgi:WD40 repeat protein